MEHMDGFRLVIPIKIRYGDLDPQWHVNNARYLTFLEQARTEYLQRLGLWDGEDFLKIGIILADVHLAFQSPVYLNQNVVVGIRTVHIGNKSIRFEYQIEDEDTGKSLARAETVVVHYDYEQLASTPVPDDWRKKISEFEGLKV
jgi:acyl-CoA thioester hydrolase